jgi:alkaline phosphatase
MTTGALNVLAKNDEGFFLMVEGGAVDWAGHANQTTRVVEEQVEFNEAVETIDAWVAANSSWDETLVIITADHETGYLTGPGADPTWTPMTGQAGSLPNVSWHSGDHTNALVPLFAKGAGSALLESRATSWDRVRGAYLDNTDIGNTLFDLFGSDYTGGSGTVPLEASVGLSDGAPGTLSLAVAAIGDPVAFTESAGTMAAELPHVTVRDTRTGAQSQGGGWAVSGQATDFVAGNRVIGANNLSWSPVVVSSQSGAGAGPAGRTLAEPATLATAGEDSRLGRTVVGADLSLEVPQSAKSGRYGSDVTLTLFATD